MRQLSEVEIRRARETIARQAATIPEDRDIGPEAAWRRAEGVRTATGRRLQEVAEGPIFRLPEPPPGPVGRGA